MKSALTNWLLWQNELGEDFLFSQMSGALTMSLKENQQQPHYELNKKNEQNKIYESQRGTSSPAQALPANLLAKNSPSSLVSNNSSECLASTLDELKELLRNFDGCALKETATQMVFADGNPNSKILLIGEAPGVEEDKLGIPFVGQSGQLLDKMMAAVGLNRKNSYITNVVNWRPPGNRPPTQEEIDQCWPFLKRHIELVHPERIVLLGATAMKAVLKISTGLSKNRGQWHRYPSIFGDIPTLVTFHPSYLLRSPGQKKLAWDDFQKIRDVLS
jgi:DNA polymerase